MLSCDVLIVGGGPAGSSCAWRLVKAGLDVLVLDRKAFPRDKPCAGWITPAVLHELHIDPDEYRQQGRVLEPITAFCTSLMGGAEVETDYARPISFGVRRCEFDHYLLQRSGARLRLAEPLKTLERRKGAGSSTTRSTPAWSSAPAAISARWPASSGPGSGETKQR